MKAYLRVDPLLTVRKAHYTDGQFRATFAIRRDAPPARITSWVAA